MERRGGRWEGGTGVTVVNRRGGLLITLSSIPLALGLHVLLLVGRQDLQMDAGRWIEWGSNERLCQAALISVAPREAHW